MDGIIFTIIGTVFVPLCLVVYQMIRKIEHERRKPSLFLVDTNSWQPRVLGYYDGVVTAKITGMDQSFDIIRCKNPYGDAFILVTEGSADEIIMKTTPHQYMIVGKRIPSDEIASYLFPDNPMPIQLPANMMACAPIADDRLPIATLPSVSNADFPKLWDSVENPANVASLDTGVVCRECGNYYDQPMRVCERCGCTIHKIDK